MRIFISWSGNHSRQIAEVFRHWLPDVIQSVQPYFTPDDITKGQRWMTEIAEKLQSSQFGLFCITRENINAPWLLFEAGAVSKDTKSGKVCPLLFGVDSAQLSGPLLQFQATPYSKDELYKFLRSVNAEADHPLTETQLNRAFTRCWPELDKNIQDILTSSSPSIPIKPRSAEEMLEETLGIVRTLSSNLNSSPDADPPSHWLLSLQFTIDYINDSIQIAENAEQTAILELLKRLQEFAKAHFNLVTPKLNSKPTASRSIDQAIKCMHQLERRIEKLEKLLDSGNPF